MGAVKPDLPIVLMTGYSGPLQTPHLQAAGIREVINKPVSSARLEPTVWRGICPTQAAVLAENQQSRNKRCASRVASFS
jgi:FixJ family two-component response regulator